MSGVQRQLWPPEQEPEKESGHDMAETSKEAGREIREKGIDQEGQRAVFAILSHTDRPLSRAEIADRSDYRERTVCWRVRELMEKGLVVVVGTQVNGRGRSVEVLDVDPDYTVPRGDAER